LQADETPIRFLDPDQKKGKAQIGYFWLMGRPGSSVFIHWALSRGQKVAEELLGSFNGVLQADDYASPSSAVVGIVLLTINDLRLKLALFLHYILHKSGALGQSEA
jgi:transposase